MQNRIILYRVSLFLCIVSIIFAVMERAIAVTTIMISEETHAELKQLATRSDEFIGHFFDWLVKHQKPVFTGKILGKCDKVVNVSSQLRDSVKLASFQHRVTMGTYVQALLDGYRNNDILE